MKGCLGWFFKLWGTAIGLTVLFVGGLTLYSLIFHGTLPMAENMIVGGLAVFVTSFIGYLIAPFMKIMDTILGRLMLGVSPAVILVGLLLLSGEPINVELLILLGLCTAPWMLFLLIAGMGAVPMPSDTGERTTKSGYYPYGFSGMSEEERAYRQEEERKKWT